MLSPQSPSPHNTLQHGFTLIELMVTVAIITILATIALPAYKDYVTRSRLSEATSALSAKRVQLEQFYDNNRTYVNAPGCNNDSSTSNSFDFSCTGVDASRYTLQAVGKSSMSGFTLTINQDNARGTPSAGSGWTSNTNCWISSKAGSC